MKRPTVFQLNLLAQLPRDGSYTYRTNIKNPTTGYGITFQQVDRLLLKGYITEHPDYAFQFRLTDDAISYLNGVKIK